MSYLETIADPLDQLKDPLTAELFAIGMQDAFEGDFFSVCGIHTALDAIGSLGRKVMKEKELDAAHCVHWKRMSPALREHVFTGVARAIAYQPGLITEDEAVTRVERAKEAINEVLTSTFSIQYKKATTPTYEFNFGKKNRPEEVAPVYKEEPTTKRRSVISLLPFLKKQA